MTSKFQKEKRNKGDSYRRWWQTSGTCGCLIGKDREGLWDRLTPSAATWCKRLWAQGGSHVFSQGSPCYLRSRDISTTEPCLWGQYLFSHMAIFLSLWDIWLCPKIPTFWWPHGHWWCWIHRRFWTTFALCLKQELSQVPYLPGWNCSVAKSIKRSQWERLDLDTQKCNCHLSLSGLLSEGLLRKCRHLNS